MGLPAGDPERLFERFFRSPQAVNAHIPGTGLGLFIARAIVDAHSRPDLGVAPRERRDDIPHRAPGAAPDHPRRPGARRMSAIRVLVADDDDDILLLVATRLRRDGYEIIEARDGDEALVLLREHVPAVAVLDVGMPGLDGLQVLEAIRASDELAGIRVLLLTAKAQEQDVRRGYAAGADGYMKKPFSPAALSQAVRDLLDGATG